MCAIIGFLVESKNKHETKVEEYLKILQERGDQSFGYFYRTPDGETYFNKALTLEPLLQQIKDAPKGSWCFLHARKASHGMTGTTVDDKLAKAHPVESDDKLITLIHNGTKSSIHDTVDDSLSDSQGLATLLSKAWEGRRTYYGDIGVVLYERAGKVYLYKDGIRPLVMSEDNTIFASEPLFDTMQWKNIKNTYTRAKGDDVELNLKKQDLNLKYGKLVTIKFDVATATVKNFSVVGYPKTTTCGICKKSHIKNKETFNCCVCAIENRTIVKTIPTKTTGIVKLEPGILEMSNRRPLEVGMVSLLGIDFSAFKNAGYADIKYGGSATVRADFLHQTLDGLLFVKPNSKGKYLVKVDKVILPKTTKGYKEYAWQLKTRNSVAILGELASDVIELTDHVNITIANTITNDKELWALDTKVVNKNNSTISRLVGFPTYTPPTQYLKGK